MGGENNVCFTLYFCVLIFDLAMGDFRSGSEVLVFGFCLLLCRWMLTWVLTAMVVMAEGVDGYGGGLMAEVFLWVVLMLEGVDGSGRGCLVG